MAKKDNNEPVEAEIVEEKKTVYCCGRGGMNGKLFFGLILIIVGGMFIAQDLLNIELFKYFWPIVLILFGLSLITKSLNN